MKVRVISEIFPDSKNYYSCLTVEKTRKAPYSHAVDKSRVRRREPEGWPAPNSAGHVGAVDLERESVGQ